MFSLTNAKIQNVSNIHLGIESLPLLKSDISCQCPMRAPICGFLIITVKLCVSKPVIS
jgi:hypothetical protein